MSLGELDSEFLRLKARRFEIQQVVTKEGEIQQVVVGQRRAKLNRPPISFLTAQVTSVTCSHEKGEIQHVVKFSDSFIFNCPR